MPPYSDNLYSAEDSDTESLSDQLSPTDGYFSNREHPQDVMIEDPSSASNSNSAASKAQEAREAAATNPEDVPTPSRPSPSAIVTAAPPVQTASSETPAAAYTPSSPTHTSYTPTSPTFSGRQHGNYTETSSLLHTNPPPTYSDATSRSSESRRFSANYNTISNRLLEEGLGPQREPESMGGPVDFNEEVPVWKRHVKKLQNRHFLRNLIVGLLILGFSIGAFVASIKAGQSKKDTTEPLLPGDPRTPGSSPEEHGAYCRAATIQLSREMGTFEFDVGQDLTVLQITNAGAGDYATARVNALGKINIRSLPSDAIGDGKKGLITFDIWGTAYGLGIGINVDNQEHAVKVNSARTTTTPLPTGLSEHCVSIEINVWLPPSATFENLTFFSENLGMEVFDDINVYVSKDAAFESFSGTINWPALKSSDQTNDGPSSLEIADSSRESTSHRGSNHYSSSLRKEIRERGVNAKVMYVFTEHGSIHGTFALYDNLKLNTQSGSIDVDILPQKIDYMDPKPAILTVDTNSGHISVRCPVASTTIPRRDYRTTVKSSSGSLDLALFVGTELSADTNSGSIHLDALPNTSPADGKNAVMSTNSFSGSQQIRLLSPPGTSTLKDSPQKDSPHKVIDIGNDDPYLLPRVPEDTTAEPDMEYTRSSRIRDLTSEHTAMSGSVKVEYPEAWEGEITALTISGSLHLGGENVRIIKDSRKNWAYSEVIGRKGSSPEYASKMNIRAVSGSADIWVGDRK